MITVQDMHVAVFDCICDRIMQAEIYDSLYGCGANAPQKGGVSFFFSTALRYGRKFFSLTALCPTYFFTKQRQRSVLQNFCLVMHRMVFFVHQRLINQNRTQLTRNGSQVFRATGKIFEFISMLFINCQCHDLSSMCSRSENYV